MPTSARELAPITRIDWNTGGIPKAGPDPTDRPGWEKLLVKPSKAVVVLAALGFADGRFGLARYPHFLKVVVYSTKS